MQHTGSFQTTEVVFSGAQYSSLHDHLFQPNGDEQAAYAFVSPSLSGTHQRLLVHHIVLLQPDHFAEQNGAFLQLEGSAAEAVAKHAVENQWGLVEIHSHPFADTSVGFSSTDTGYGLPRFRWFAKKVQRSFPHVMLVFGKNSADGLIYDSNSNSMRTVDRITILNSPIRQFEMNQNHTKTFDDGYLKRTSRQIQAFGEHGQAQLARIRVGIVGLGGIGGFVTQQLALLGIRNFVLVDADTVETTNLNRLVGASIHDAVAHIPKVRVLERLIDQLDPNAKVQLFQEMFPTQATVNALKHVDVLFGCTDTHGSRMLINEFALQYMLPYIDIGVGIQSDSDGRIHEAGGQFRVLLPERFCLQCIGALDADQAARDLLPPESRATHQVRGYIPAEDIPAPSVGFLNSALASMAVGEFMNLITGFQDASEIVYYFLKGQTMKKVRAIRKEDCVSCNGTGRFAMGDLERVLGLDVPRLSIDSLPVPGGEA